MTATTIQDRCSWVCQRRQNRRLFGKNPGEKRSRKNFRKDAADVAAVAAGMPIWATSVQGILSPRVAQSDQRCLLQRGKTLTMLIRQHFDKDRGALWRPCDVPGHALWYRQLVRKRLVSHTRWGSGRQGAYMHKFITGVTSANTAMIASMRSDPGVAWTSCSTPRVRTSTGCSFNK